MLGSERDFVLHEAAEQLQGAFPRGEEEGATRAGGIPRRAIVAADDQILPFADFAVMLEVEIVGRAIFAELLWDIADPVIVVDLGLHLGGILKRVRPPAEQIAAFVFRVGSAGNA